MSLRRLNCIAFSRFRWFQVGDALGGGGIFLRTAVWKLCVHHHHPPPLPPKRGSHQRHTYWRDMRACSRNRDFVLLRPRVWNLANKIHQGRSFVCISQSRNLSGILRPPSWSDIPGLAGVCFFIKSFFKREVEQSCLLQTSTFLIYRKQSTPR